MDRSNRLILLVGIVIAVVVFTGIALMLAPSATVQTGEFICRPVSWEA